MRVFCFVFVQGNGYVLVHNAPALSPGQEVDRSVRFFHGEWFRRVSSHNVVSERDVLASREEIMMALADVSSLLIK